MRLELRTWRLLAVSQNSVGLPALGRWRRPGSASTGRPRTYSTGLGAALQWSMSGTHVLLDGQRVPVKHKGGGTPHGQGTSAWRYRWLQGPAITDIKDAQLRDRFDLDALRGLDLN